MAWARVTGATLATSDSPAAGGSTYDFGNLGAAVSANDRVIAVIMLADQGNITTSSIADSLGNTWTKDTSIQYSDGAYENELSVWSTVSAAGNPGNIGNGNNR